jgi:uncharacterized protein
MGYWGGCSIGRPPFFFEAPAREGAVMPNEIVATPAARTALAKVQATHGPVIFHITGGCCDARSPLCLPVGEFRLGARDLLIGEVEGVPVYEMEAAPEPCCCCGGCYLLDLVEGLTVGFSLEAAPGKRFAIREVRASNVCCEAQSQAC